MKKKYAILIILLLIIIFVLFHTAITRYLDIYKPIKDYYLTAHVAAENKAYVYDCGKMKGNFIENSNYKNVIMVTQYKNENNYIAFVQDETYFYLIKYANGKISGSITLLNPIDKLSTWKNNAIFLMKDVIYVADFDTNSYTELLTSVDINNIQESFFVYNDKILYSKTNPENKEINDWYIFSDSEDKFVVSTHNASPIHGWISDDELLLNSDEKGNYIYNLKNDETVYLDGNFYPPSYVVGEQGILIAHAPKKNALNTSEVFAINIQTNKKIRLYSFPFDCVGSGGVNFDLSTKE